MAGFFIKKFKKEQNPYLNSALISVFHPTLSAYHMTSYDADDEEYYSSFVDDDFYDFEHINHSQSLLPQTLVEEGL